MSLGAIIGRGRRAWILAGAGLLLALGTAGSTQPLATPAGRTGGAGGTSAATAAGRPGLTASAPLPGRGTLGPAPAAVAVTTTAAAPGAGVTAPVASAGSLPAGAGPGRTSAGSRSAAPTTAAPVIPRPETNRSAPNPSPAPVEARGAVWPGDFPDPSVLKVGLVYYAYSTEVGLDAVPTIRSVDLVHWSFVGDALANLPAWSNGTDVWAPAVVAGGVGYVLFYATRDARTGDQCIGRAQATSPTGPFVDTTIDPFVCQLDQGGDIDPDPVVAADGTDWLLFKSQGTLEGQSPRIWAQRVSAGWNALQGAPVAILGLSQRWEGSVVEAPAMVRSGSQYLLFYSGNDWATGRYAIGYAVCRSVSGPCAKPVNGPVLASNGDEAGPGSPGLFTDGLGHIRVAFHAWAPGRIGYPGGARSLRIGTVSIIGGRPTISG